MSDAERLRRSGEAADAEFASTPASAPVLPCGLALKTWVDFKLIDDEGNPVPDRKIQVTLPGGRVIEGVTNADGCFGFDQLDPGECEVTLLDLPEHSCELVG